MLSGSGAHPALCTRGCTLGFLLGFARVRAGVGRRKNRKKKTNKIKRPELKTNEKKDESPTHRGTQRNAPDPASPQSLNLKFYRRRSHDCMGRVKGGGTAPVCVSPRVPTRAPPGSAPPSRGVGHPRAPRGGRVKGGGERGGGRGGGGGGGRSVCVERRGGGKETLMEV